MTPIATTESNAFDSPVATGNDTDTTGQSTIRVPSGQHLYLRAWDPGLNYFPNNFYEVLPGGDSIPKELVIQMVPASSLSVQFLLPDDQLAADTNIGLMLFHPTRGPWWPTESQTNSEGVVTFDHLPAGEYVLRFKSETGARLEHAQTALPPNAQVDLGMLSLQ